jgi:CubicO group peptidase (beta-lactamase class C family)
MCHKPKRGLAKFCVWLMAFVLLATGCAGFSAAPSGPYWPTKGWRTSTPEAQGMDAQKLAQLLDVIGQEPMLNLHSLLVIRHGYLVSEVYFNPAFGPNTKHVLYSVTKSFIATLVGIALDQGLLDSLRHPVLDYFPRRTIENRDARKEAMTLEDLLTMQSGLDWQEGPSAYASVAGGALDGAKFVLDEPMKNQPGTQFLYCSGCSHVLSAILQQQPGLQTLDFARNNLFKPLGISDYAWDTDSQGIALGGWGLSLTPRDMAKLGYLYLHDGQWDGQQIVSAAWVKTATQTHANPQHKLGFGYGYQWWTYPRLDAYMAIGANGQLILVAPASDLVVVVTADQGDLANEAVFKLIESYILTAVKSSTPLPPNPAGQAELTAQTKASRRLPPVLPRSPAAIRSTADQWFVLILGAFGLWAIASKSVYLGGADSVSGWAARGLGLAVLAAASLRVSNNTTCNLLAAYGDSLDLTAYLLALIAVCGGLVAHHAEAACPSAHGRWKWSPRAIPGWVFITAGAGVGCLLGIAVEKPALFSVVTLPELGYPMLTGLGLAVIPVVILGYPNPAPATVSKVAVLVSSLLLGWLVGYLGQAVIDLLEPLAPALTGLASQGFIPLLSRLNPLAPGADSVAEVIRRWFILFLIATGVWALVSQRLYLGGGYQITGWGARGLGLLVILAALLHTTYVANTSAASYILALCFSHNTVTCLLALAILLSGLLARRTTALRPPLAALLNASWVFTALGVGVGCLVGVAFADSALFSRATPAILGRLTVTCLGLAAGPLAVLAQGYPERSRRSSVTAIVGAMFLGSMFGYIGETILSPLFPVG